VLTDNSIIAFVPAVDLARAKTFYGGLLGMTLVSEDRFALGFNGGGTMLRVAHVPNVVATAHTVLGWQVDDIQTSMVRLKAAGIRFERYPGFDQTEDGVWTAPSGARIAWFKDIEGNLLSLTQF
jgi:predicted enzyme related to lactoylglutathione lyase